METVRQTPKTFAHNHRTLVDKVVSYGYTGRKSETTST